MDELANKNNRQDLTTLIKEVEKELEALDKTLWLQVDEKKLNKNRVSGKIGMKTFLLGKIEMLQDESAQLELDSDK
tara:strand:- start:203 stop:430 length:228 start_codon:yes stop_codon:yes gene_type:complete